MHRISPAFKTWLIGRRFAQRIDDASIILTSKRSFRDLKALFRPAQGTEIPALILRTDHHMLLLQYPHRALESQARPRL